MNPQPLAPGETRRPASAWQVGGQPAHFDPLLECLVELTGIHGVPWTRESLVAGLPLENNLLTPSLLPRAAAPARPAARRAAPGDLLIIASFAQYDEAERATYAPKLVYADAQNRIARTGDGIPTQKA